MAQGGREYELILLGATGYTGKLCAEWISTNLPNDLKWAIAGRNAKKLQTVVDELMEMSPSRKSPGKNKGLFILSSQAHAIHHTRHLYPFTILSKLNLDSSLSYEHNRIMMSTIIYVSI